MSFKNILYIRDKEKGIVKIVINRAEVRNALNLETRKELSNAVSKLRQDKKARVVIITGAGDKSFASGSDIREFLKVTPAAIEERNNTFGTRLYYEIENLPMPVIAMINGFCFGGGNELAMSCDIRICSDNAKFGQLEINVGIIPGAGATQRLPRLVGWGKAKELIYTGRIIDAEEALRIGLVDKVVPQPQLEKVVADLAESIVSKSPLALKLAKKAINRGMYTDIAAGLAYEASCFSLLFSTKDQKEGANAFLEKRKPNFKGK